MTALTDLAGFDLGEHELTYDEAKVILYALSVGSPSTDLDHVYERDLVALPTLACAMGLWAVEAAGRTGAYDPHRSLHASQTLQMHAPLPAAGTITMRGQVTEVLDKGSAALVKVLATSEVFDVGYEIFLPGLGGWGGPRGEKSARREFMPEHHTAYDTPDNLAALYRLTGDRHPIHIDPVTAQANGFERPILHGLCTLGIATRLAAEVSGRAAHEVAGLSARLSAPVLPGQMVEVAAGLGDGGEILFEASVAGTTVISQGVATFAPPAS